MWCFVELTGTDWGPNASLDAEQGSLERISEFIL